MGTSYLVTGAKLRCMWGSRPGTLVIAQGHNFVASGRPKANCADCKKEENIMDFGTCGLSSCGRSCKECMSLADKWVNTSGSSWKEGPEWKYRPLCIQQQRAALRSKGRKRRYPVLPI